MNQVNPGCHPKTAAEDPANTLAVSVGEAGIEKGDVYAINSNINTICNSKLHKAHVPHIGRLLEFNSN